MEKYFKGRHKESRRRAYFKIYNEVKTSKFGLYRGDYQVEAYFIDETGRELFPSREACEEVYEIQREISAEEFDSYNCIQTIVEELFMNQFTGGFPREGNVMPNYKTLGRQLNRYFLDKQGGNDHMMGGLVTWDLAEGNPGALTFMGATYKLSPFKAETAFKRMKDNKISGCKLYMLWNDCCDRNTEKALDIMLTRSIEDIEEHINYENGRGIPYVEEETI